MAVGFDAASFRANATTNSPIAFAGHTVGAGTDMALVVSVAWQTQVATGISLVWDAAGANQAMSLLVDMNSGSATLGRVLLYGLRNPVPGNRTLTLSFASNADFKCLMCASFSGVNQTSNAAAFTNLAANIYTTGVGPDHHPVNVTSDANSYAFMTGVNGNTNGQAMGGGTVILTDVMCQTNYQAGAAPNVTFTINNAFGGDFIVYAGINVSPSAIPVTTLNSQIWM